MIIVVGTPCWENNTVKRKAKYILVAVVIVAALSLMLIPRGESQRATVRLTGSAGLPFAGAIISDGVEVEVTGALPTDFAVSGRNVECRFRKTQADGTLRINILMPDSASCSATTSSPQGSVRAFIQNSLFRGGFGTSCI